MIVPRIKYFAERDYEGLSWLGKRALRKRRSEYAKALKTIRKIENIKNPEDYLIGRTFESEVTLKGGGVTSKINHESVGNNWDSARNYRHHRKGLYEKILNSADEASNKMREKTIAEEPLRKKLLGQKLKKAGYVGLGVAGAAGLAYGGKKLYDKYKKDHDSTKE